MFLFVLALTNQMESTIRRVGLGREGGGGGRTGRPHGPRDFLLLCLMAKDSSLKGLVWWEMYPSRCGRSTGGENSKMG